MVTILHSDNNTLHHDGVIKWKHFPHHWSFVWGIHRSPVNSRYKGHWRGALMFSLICARINDWVNNREAGDLRRYRTHYNIIVMMLPLLRTWPNDILTDDSSAQMGNQCGKGVLGILAAAGICFDDDGPLNIISALLPQRVSETLSGAPILPCYTIHSLGRPGDSSADIYILVNTMMTSSNGSIFRVTGHLCGEFTGHRWIPRTQRPATQSFDVIFFIFACINSQVNNRKAGDLRRHRGHYDVTTML